MRALPLPVHSNKTIIADIATILPEHQCGPVDNTAKHRAAATQHGLERHSERNALHANTSALPGPHHRRDKALERQYLSAAFKRAAMVANGAEEAAALGLQLSRLPFEDCSLNDWAEAGIEAVNQISDKELTAGWVYGMLELLERLTLACDKSTDGRARKNLLLVRARFIFFRRSCECD